MSLKKSSFIETANLQIRLYQDWIDLLDVKNVILLVLHCCFGVALVS
ncbi:protein of unknown function [Vibrio tapetis subsp. tapetis]|uniref:Uncharacterized protein n=1 Tax=Vibrio tapetis subsp. tapetis TaxID=1671868 RepID=A0A2N8ZI45_9VIBR|nr:protein of unknown function [Vibrio tapetis subsp. tapetis]